MDQRMTKPLLVKLIKKNFFLNYNKVVFFKKGKKKKKKKGKGRWKNIIFNILTHHNKLNEGQVASLSQLRVDCHIQGLNAGKWTQSQNREHNSAWKHSCLTSDHFIPSGLAMCDCWGNLCSSLSHLYTSKPQPQAVRCCAAISLRFHTLL